MGSSKKSSSRAVVIIDDRSQRDSSVYSRSSYGGYSTMNSDSDRSSSRESSPRSGGAYSGSSRSSRTDYLTRVNAHGQEVQIHNHHAAGYSRYDPHPTYQVPSQRHNDSSRRS